MTRHSLISEGRLHLIEQRQMSPGWGAEYQPAMRANRDEAPTRSRPSTMYSQKLGRDLHFMSIPERHACLLALYHPGLFDIHEQHMLHTIRAPHPLAGRNDTKRMTLLPFKGTIDVAERLGRVTKHPVIWRKVADNSEEQVPYAFPYLGDLLLFLRDAQGPYCVNWSVKSSYTDFFERHRHSTNGARPHEITKEELGTRHRLEQMYFADAGIPTQFLATEDLDQSVLSNLQSLFVRSQRTLTLPHDVVQQMTSIVQTIVGTQETVLSLLPTLMSEFNCPREDCLAVVSAAIWHRQIRVDLHRPVLVDKPLRAERSDILNDYSHLFAK